MALFESYDRRIDHINAVLKEYGINGIEDADRSNLSESGRCPFNFTQESFVGIILKLIGEAVLIVVSGFSAAFGVAETVKNHDNAIDRKM